MPSISDEGGPELSPGFEDELNVNESDSEAEEDERSRASEEDHGEWTGFSHSSEADEDPAPSPAKLLETATFTPTPQPGSKYTPPHLRKAAMDPLDKSSESLVKLTKQLNGLLNRYAPHLSLSISVLKAVSLSEQNISSILDGVEDAYRNHSRNGMRSPLPHYVSSGLIEAL